MDTLQSSSTTPPASAKLAGKIALITGGTSGIGLATAKRFVAEGAYVFITGRRQANLDEAVREIGHEHAAALQGDSAQARGPGPHLRRRQSAERPPRRDFRQRGALAPLVPLGHITEEHFDSIYNTNVKGVVFTVQKALPLMSEGGTIILNASGCRHQRHAGLQHLQLDQGGGAQPGAQLGAGPQRARHPRQRRQPGSGADARLRWPRTDQGAGARLH